MPILAACLAVIGLAPVGAAEPTFAELLDRAEAQAAAGRQWGPPGDNLTDTFLEMSKILPTATPQQLVAFEALLHKEQDALAQSADPPEPAPRRAPQAEASVAPQAEASVAPQAEASVAPQIGASAARAPPVSEDIPPKRESQPWGVAARPVSPPTVAASDLFERGEKAEALGDISGARRFFASAAQSGHAGAARALARLYDPDYLRRHTIGGIGGDAELARFWNEKADELGSGVTAAIPEARLAR